MGYIREQEPLFIAYTCGRIRSSSGTACTCRLLLYYGRFLALFSRHRKFSLASFMVS